MPFAQNHGMAMPLASTVNCVLADISRINLNFSFHLEKPLYFYGAYA
jgi:hypothetical protein